METEVKTEVEKTTEEVQEKWDRERQRADQAESVAAKAREEVQVYAEELGETKAELKQARADLETAKREVQKKDDSLDQMDAGLVDPAVIANFEKIQLKVAQLEQKNKELEEKAKQSEADRIERQRSEANARARDDVLNQCDSEFSPKYRTEALKLADKLVDSGEEKQPNDRFSGYLLMKKCYQKVAQQTAEKEKSKETSVPTDSGKSSVSHTTQTRKTGTRQEVLADMKKDKSWMTG